MLLRRKREGEEGRRSSSQWLYIYIVLSSGKPCNRAAAGPLANFAQHPRLSLSVVHAAKISFVRARSLLCLASSGPNNIIG